MKGINTITANFSNGGRQCITRKLFQYDYGQKVLIKGLTLPQSFEFHISNSNSPKASSNIFLGNNNEIIIPDEYLTSGEDIYIWIFLHQTTSDGQTRYTINIPVQKRPKAESKEPTQVEQNVIDQLISSLEQKVDEISAATEQAKDTFLKYPKIVDDYWYAYDIQTKDWINTEIKALGEDGLGIKNVSLNNDYTLTITFTDDTVFITESIRGQKGQKGDTGVTPNLTIGTIETLPAEGYASVNIKGTAENPVLDFKIPRGYKGDKGDTGAMPNITIGTVNNLEPGSAPYVTQTGTAENPVLTFGLVKGEKGDTGEQGLQGPKGDKGDTGEQGPQGIQGETGATGPQGEKGQKGDKGEQGNRGEQGNVGPRGQKGQTGATGPKGDTPVKGTDYWTAADKEQIIEDILTSQDITDLKDQIDSKEDALNYSNPVQGFALTAKTIENGKVTEWDFSEAGGLKIHICSSSEYSSESRIPIINNPDEKTIYLVPASYQPSNNMFTEWVYINNTWEIFGSVAVDLSNYLTDVQTNGTSIINNGVANIPVMSENNYGVAKILNDTDYGIKLNKIGNISDVLTTSPASASQIKRAAASYNPIAPINEHYAVFYGLANAAGQNERNSELPIGQYTNEAKTAIQTMLDVPSTNTVSTLSDAVQGLDSDVQGLQTAVQSKADAQTVAALSGTVTGLQTSKADKSYVDTQLSTKASTATATASTDGLMSAQDKSRLDAVYADYSSALAAIGGGS